MSTNTVMSAGVKSITIQAFETFTELHRAVNAARYKVHKPGCDCGKMKTIKYDGGFTILPDSKSNRQRNLYRFPIQSGQSLKEAELLLRNELFPPDDSNFQIRKTTPFKIKCAVCLLVDEPNGFVGIASNQKSVVESVRLRAHLEAANAKTWHHDHALFTCVLPATLISSSVHAKTRSQREQAQNSMMECLELQKRNAILNGNTITIGHHLQTMVQLLHEDADYWFVMVQREDDTTIVLDLPGGKRHLAETSLECAIRETREETSLIVDSTWIETILKHEKEPGNHYYHMKPPTELLDETLGVTTALSKLSLVKEK